MMILAGVDEAGLGPTLGPLVTAGAALAVPDFWSPDTPWDALSAAFCREWGRKESRTAVADSKVVYRKGGAAALELAVGAFSLLANASPVPSVCFPGLDGGIRAHPCYGLKLNPFPAYVGAELIEDRASAMGSALKAASATAVHLRASALHEPVFNRRIAAGMNKNQLLLTETGGRLREIVEKFPENEILVVVDKQGGRNDYLPFLVALFPGAWIEDTGSGAVSSSYRLRRAGGDVTFRFEAKADRHSFATALASLAAKYVRERAMAELNAWFCERVEGLAATAGYPEDARRWLGELEKSGLDMEAVVRRR